MAFFQNRVVFPKEEYPEILEEYDLEEEEEEEDDYVLEPHEYLTNNETEQSHSTSSAIPTVILALPNAATAVAAESPEPKRQRIEQVEEKKSMEDSRKLFQRLWTDEDEIVILQGFLDYNANRGSAYHNDSASFYDQIKSKLQLDFNKSQLVDKLRRLKKKYRNLLQKFDSGKDFFFKTAHEQATFEISHKIWNIATPIGIPVEDDGEVNPNPNPSPNSGHTTPVKNEPVIEKKRKGSRTATEEKQQLRRLNDNSAMNKDNHNNSTNNNSSNAEDESGDKSNSRHNVPVLIEETVKSCLTPFLKELTSTSNNMGSPFGFGGRGIGGGSFSLNPMPFSFLNFGNGDKVGDERWKKQQILELEVYSKRLELVQDEIKVALEDLRSGAGAGAGGSRKF
ncbi:unnamed protein product [Lathyrus sativus]|nr:unnamed protein product [Lathyrus sativus]